MFVFQQQQNLGRIFGSSKMLLSPQWLKQLFVSGGGSVVIDTLFIVTLIVCGVLCLVLVYYAALSVLSSFPIILV